MLCFVILVFQHYGRRKFSSIEAMSLLLVRDLAPGKKNSRTTKPLLLIRKQFRSLPTTCPDIGNMMSTQHADSKKLNRECLLKILSNLQFLARQGIPIRGDGDEADSNFIQLLKVRGRDDPRIETWMQR